MLILVYIQIDTEITIDLCSCTGSCTDLCFLALSTEGAQKQPPTAVSTSGAQILFLNAILLKEPGPAREIANRRAGTGKIKDKPAASYNARK